MKKPLIYLGLLAVVAILLATLTREQDIDIPPAEVVPTIDEVRYSFGFDESQYRIEHDTIAQNQFMGDILIKHIDYPAIESLLRNAKDTFDPRRIRVGRPYHIIHKSDNDSTAIALVYEQDAVNYTVLHLSDSLYAELGEKEITTREDRASGVITSSLYLTLTEQGLSQALAMELADIYAWTIDFYRLQEGDRFEVLYDQRFIEDEFIGIGEIKACSFTHKDKTFKAYLFAQNDKQDYFDEHGEGLRKAFLKSPLKFGRMTSGYSGRRFHPVQRRFKAHKGTDYAAATGTPILATGDGTVIESRKRGGNGNYVKIRHNSTYTTQYLHMSKRIATVGQIVKQGETIGLVGSTGLATGPHVCYRFWKNGEQVDHRKENFPSSDPVLDSEMERFLREVRELEDRLHQADEIIS